MSAALGAAARHGAAMAGRCRALTQRVRVLEEEVRWLKAELARKA